MGLYPQSLPSKMQASLYEKTNSPRFLACSKPSLNIFLIYAEERDLNSSIMTNECTNLTFPPQQRPFRKPFSTDTISFAVDISRCFSFQTSFIICYLYYLKNNQQLKQKRIPHQQEHSKTQSGQKVPKQTLPSQNHPFCFFCRFVQKGQKISHNVNNKIITQQMNIEQKVIKQLGIKPELHRIFAGCGNKGSIYISNFATAVHSNLLQTFHIKSVLSAAKGCWIQSLKTGQRNFNENYKANEAQKKSYMYIPLTDKKTTNIRKYFQEAFQFINEGRLRGNVLIHCKAGVSRSATIATAYLMKTYQYNLAEAYFLLQSVCARVSSLLSQVKPNDGFIEQLIEYHQQLGGNKMFYSITNNNFYLEQEPQEKEETIIDGPKGEKGKLGKIGRRLQKENEIIVKKINKIKRLIQSNRKSPERSEFLKHRLDVCRKKKQKENVLGDRNQDQLRVQYTGKMEIHGSVC